MVSGVDLSSSAIELARKNFAQQGLQADLREADGEQLPFANESFDLVYAHGVVQYTAHPQQLVDECRRVLKPGGEAIFQVYNRVSWLNALSKLMKVPLEHEDAPVLLKYSAGEFRALLRGFSRHSDCRRAISGEVTSAQRMERDAVQHVFRRCLQRAAAVAGASVWLAPSGVLPQMRPIMIVKAHAFGNDFVLVESRAIQGTKDLPALAQAICARHRGIGADGLIVYSTTPLWRVDAAAQRRRQPIGNLR